MGVIIHCNNIGGPPAPLFVWTSCRRTPPPAPSCQLPDGAQWSCRSESRLLCARLKIFENRQQTCIRAVVYQKHRLVIRRILLLRNIIARIVQDLVGHNPTNFIERSAMLHEYTCTIQPSLVVLTSFYYCSLFTVATSAYLNALPLRAKKKKMPFPSTRKGGGMTVNWNTSLPPSTT